MVLSLCRRSSRIYTVDHYLPIPPDLDELHDLLAQPLTPAESQLCNRIIAVIAQMFKKNVAEYLKVQEKYRSATREKVARQLRIAYPNAPDSEIQELSLEDPQAVKEAIAHHIQRGGHPEDLAQTLADLHDRWERKISRRHSRTCMTGGRGRADTRRPA